MLTLTRAKVTDSAAFPHQVTDYDLFQTVALFENKDMLAVLTNIQSLGRVAQVHCRMH